MHVNKVLRFLSLFHRQITGQQIQYTFYVLDLIIVFVHQDNRLLFLWAGTRLHRYPRRDVVSGA